MAHKKGIARQFEAFMIDPNSVPVPLRRGMRIEITEARLRVLQPQRRPTGGTHLRACALNGKTSFDFETPDHAHLVALLMLAAGEFGYTRTLVNDKTVFTVLGREWPYKRKPRVRRELPPAPKPGDHPLSVHIEYVDEFGSRLKNRLMQGTPKREGLGFEFLWEAARLSHDEAMRELGSSGYWNLRRYLEAKGHILGQALPEGDYPWNAKSEQND